MTGVTTTLLVLATAAGLLALAVSYRHSVARHVADVQEAMHRELRFLADALAAGAGARAAATP